MSSRCATIRAGSLCCLTTHSVTSSIAATAQLSVPSSAASAGDRTPLKRQPDRVDCARPVAVRDSRTTSRESGQLQDGQRLAGGASAQIECVLPLVGGERSPHLALEQCQRIALRKTAQRDCLTFAPERPTFRRSEKEAFRDRVAQDI